MQNPIQTFLQSPIVFEKPAILLENLKTLTSVNYRRVEFLCTFLPYQFVQNSVRDFFKFFLDLQLFAKIKKGMISTHSQKPVFYILINNSRSKQK